MGTVHILSNDAGEETPLHCNSLAACDFERNGKSIIKNERNVLIALAKMGVRLSYNEFSYETLIEGFPGHGPVLNDLAEDSLYLAVADEFKLKPAFADFQKIIGVEAYRNRFHPVRDYLGRAQEQWDGVERIDEWLSTYLGAEDDAKGVTRAVGRLTLIGAARRVRKPGCKFDTMPVLEGEQGAGKSRGLQALCPNPDWFSDAATLMMSPKELMEVSAGKWLLEVGELAGLRRAEVEHVKATLSRQRDESRMAYGRRTTRRPRQFIFAATTNEEQYLQDRSGNRRFLPVKTGRIDVDAIARDRDQLWGEAAHFEAQGEAIHLSKDMSDAIVLAQREREIADEWEGIVAAFLNEKYPHSLDAEREQKTTLADVADGALAIERGRFDGALQKRVTAAMRKCGWKMTQRSHGKNYWTRVKVENPCL